MNFDYKKPSKQLALDIINQRLPYVIRARDIQFKDITYLDEGIYNTRATIVPTEDSEFYGIAVVEYDRINMAYFFRGVSVLIEPAYQKLLSDLLPTINGIYGLALTKDDIVDGIIETTQLPYKVSITIKEDNPAYYGTFSVIIRDPNKSLTDLFNDISIGGIPYPSQDKNKIQGPLYFYASDYTVLKNVFSLYREHDLADDVLLDAINHVDDVKWLIDDELQPFNLKFAKISYHGPIEEANAYTKRNDFTHVFVIQVDEDYCNNISGPLVLHYNQYP